VVAADHAAVAQAADPFQAGGRRDAEFGGHVPVGAACVVLQHPQQRRIKFVHDRKFGRSAERCSVVERRSWSAG
jgi:hypothetical protein